MYSDSHAHLVDYSPEQLTKIIALMRKKKVDFALAVGVNLDSSAGTIKLAKTYNEIKGAVGIHPWFALKLDADMRKRFEKLAGSKFVRAIGEIGLDYAPPTIEPPKGTSPEEHSQEMSKMQFPENMLPLPMTPASPEVQKELFFYEISIALKYGLPVNIHCLGGAHPDMMEILRDKVPAGLSGIAHSFEGDLNMLQDWLALGFYIAFGTKQVIKEPIAGLEDIVRAIPLDKLVIETDANPMMSPENGPVDVIPIVEKIASIRKMPTDDIGNITTANLKSVLKL